MQIKENDKINSEKMCVERKCRQCANKYNKSDLCEIRRKIDNTFDCINYDKCMKNKCSICKNERNCFLNC